MTAPGKSRPATRIRVVAIGASAGGFSGLMQLLPELPRIRNCALLIVVHLHPQSKGLLADILRRKIQSSHGHWKVKQAEDGDRLRTGVAYIAPPDLHLTLLGNRLHLSSTAPVRWHRPSVDVLFGSVAREGGPGAIAVLLSGAGCDGCEGLRLMKMSGATTIVQDPAEAIVSSMPEHGIETGCVDFVIPSHSIGLQITMLCAQG